MMASMTRVSRTLSVMLTVLFALPALVAPVAAQSESMQSQLTGVTIAWDPVYELQSDLGYVDDSLEMIVFAGMADVLSIGFLPALVDINAARDIMVESLVGETTGFATIDRGEYAGVSYSLDMMNLDGQEMGVFSLFMNQRPHGFAEFYVFIAPPAYFAAAMQTAQQSVSIDGVPVLDGIDAQAMGDLVVANVGITGGTAETDISGLTDAPTDPTAVPATSDQDARTAYLQAVNAEYVATDEPLLAILFHLDELNNGGDAQVIRPQIDEAAAALVGTSDRVAAIQPPAGMEAFHQEFTAWGGALTTAGVAWQNFVGGQSTSEDFLASLTAALDAHIAFGEVLFAEPVTSDAPVATDAPAGTDTGDAAAYIQSVEEQRVAFVTSYLEFNDLTGGLSSDATEAEIQESLQATYAIAEGWSGYATTAAQLTPPAGLENVHALYLSWADEVSLLGNLWMGAINQDGTTAEDFTAQLGVVLTVDEELGAAIDAVDTGTTTTTGSTRSTRTTSTEAPVATETGGRTTRTTTAETPVATETPSRTTRSTRSTSQSTTTSTTGNTSETKGRTSSLGTTAANEWYMEVNDVTIAWSDEFALNDSVDEPQISDAAEAEDKIYLQWLAPDGSTPRFTVTVFASSGDATGLIGSLVDDEAALQDLFGAEAILVDSVLDPQASAMLINSVDEQGEFWVYLQVTCVAPDCSSVSLFLLANAAEPVVLTLEAMEEGVAIDGIPVSNAIPFNEVEDAIVGFAR